MIRVLVNASQAWSRIFLNSGENIVICGPSKAEGTGRQCLVSPGSEASPNGHPTWEELAEKQIPNQS